MKMQLMMTLVFLACAGIANAGTGDIGSSTEFSMLDGRSRLGNEIGRTLLGNEFVPGKDLNFSVAGKNGCSADFEINNAENDGKTFVNIFVLSLNKGNKSVLIQAGNRPRAISVTDSKGVKTISFESEGPCGAGLLWGSRGCDQSKSKLVIRKNSRGEIVRIEAREAIDHLFTLPQSLKCDF